MPRSIRQEPLPIESRVADGCVLEDQQPVGRCFVLVNMLVRGRSMFINLVVNLALEMKNEATNDWDMFNSEIAFDRNGEIVAL